MTQDEALRILYPGLMAHEARSQNTAERLKRAYRQRSFDCHPDRAEALGLPEQVLFVRFNRLQEAHSLLSEQLCVLSSPPPRVHSPRTTTAQCSNTVFFGEFLVRDGVVSRHCLQAVLRRQSRLRPSFGSTAVKLGFIDQPSLSRILRDESFGERIGNHLLRHGHITASQRLSILAQQRAYCGPVGELLVEAGVLTAHELRLHLRRYFVRRAKDTHSTKCAA